jgi:hypothetical protein
MTRESMRAEALHRIAGPTSMTDDAGRHLQEQARRCAAGDHVYTWSGQIVDVPGGSPHLVMACAYGAVHEDGGRSPRRIGPPLTPENTAKHLWTEAELEEAAPRL